MNFTLTFLYSIYSTLSYLYTSKLLSSITFPLPEELP